MTPATTADIVVVAAAATKMKKNKKKKARNPKKAIPLVAMRRDNASSSNQSPRKRKRNNHLSSLSAGTTDPSRKSSGFSNTAESLELIAAYHTLNKRLEQNARDDSITKEQRKSNAEALRQEQQDLGGIERYQQASMYGAKSSKFVCANWVEPLLRDNLKRPGGNPNTSSKEEELQDSQRSHLPRILDVGAIDNQYLKFDWIEAVPIDLNAQHPSVVKADFFDYAHTHCSNTNEKDHENKPFDAIVLSLVLNFQGDPRNRGDMLALAADPRLLRPNGLLFVALPAASLDNSRYCDQDRFIQVASALGLDVVETKRSAKLTLMTFRRDPERGMQAYNPATKMFDYGEAEMGRAPAKPGAQRNNFAVMLKTSTVAR